MFEAWVVRVLVYLGVGLGLSWFLEDKEKPDKPYEKALVIAFWPVIVVGGFVYFILCIFMED
jgi:hypothetical protein